MRLIGQAHTLVHQNGVLRVQSDVRVGTRYAIPPFYSLFPSSPFSLHPREEIADKVIEPTKNNTFPKRWLRLRVSLLKRKIMISRDRRRRRARLLASWRALRRVMIGDSAMSVGLITSKFQTTLSRKKLRMISMVPVRSNRR